MEECYMPHLHIRFAFQIVCVALAQKTVKNGLTQFVTSLSSTNGKRQNDVGISGGREVFLKRVWQSKV